MNRERITSELLLVAEMFQESLSETRITGYCEALSDLPDDDVLSAMRESVKRCKFFPRVAELREIVGSEYARQREHDRALRISQDAERRRIEQEDWARDRKGRGQLPAPIPIRSIAQTISRELNASELEARRAELQEQARKVAEDDEDGGSSSAS